MLSFRLSPTRETALFRTSLQGYEGVLVSDFYGGYDSMPCRQQKCWAHLIRDLNDDLWKNPFLRSTNVRRPCPRPYSSDLSGCLTFGLKSRHLHKHMKHVDRFYRQHIEGEASSCEIVHKYQKRFERYRDSLFLFLTEDGIPWNNNMAERAIRHFAVQRKISRRVFCERGHRVPATAGNRPILPFPRQIVSAISCYRRRGMWTHSRIASDGGDNDVRRGSEIRRQRRSGRRSRLICP